MKAKNWAVPKLVQSDARITTKSKANRDPVGRNPGRVLFCAFYGFCHNGACAVDDNQHASWRECTAKVTFAPEVFKNFAVLPAFRPRLSRGTIMIDFSAAAARTGVQSMNAEQILAHLRKQPFEPFRIFMSDGSSYEVRHPELAIVRRREVVIALPQIPDRLAKRLVYCDPLHVTRIEPTATDSSVTQN